ncbi:hypothetical protein BJY01DRAFT_211497 [Aspergillus pseudoustus]|uniref:Uncharacterized protein n=1 Tax=Aspergillus pseudoustus TaxID=1810923 RepID=A0ABR4KB96_9EURO
MGWERHVWFKYSQTHGQTYQRLVFEAHKYIKRYLQSIYCKKKGDSPKMPKSGTATRNTVLRQTQRRSDGNPPGCIDGRHETAPKECAGTCGSARRSETSRLMTRQAANARKFFQRSSFLTYAQSYRASRLILSQRGIQTVEAHVLQYRQAILGLGGVEDTTTRFRLHGPRHPISTRGLDDIY